MTWLSLSAEVVGSEGANEMLMFDSFVHIDRLKEEFNRFWLLDSVDCGARLFCFPSKWRPGYRNCEITDQ